jgi:hypothetical protein
MHFWIYTSMFRQVIAIIRVFVVSSEATEAVCIVDVYGLRPVQSGQLSWDVTKSVQWVQFLQELNPLYTLGSCRN